MEMYDEAPLSTPPPPQRMDWLQVTLTSRHQLAQQDMMHARVNLIERICWLCYYDNLKKFNIYEITRLYFMFFSAIHSKPTIYPNSAIIDCNI